MSIDVLFYGSTWENIGGRSYPGKAKMLTLVKKYYNDLIQCTTVREIKEVLDAIDAIASSTEAKTSSKSSTHEESKTAESKTAESKTAESKTAE